MVTQEWSCKAGEGSRGRLGGFRTKVGAKVAAIMVRGPGYQWDTDRQVSGEPGQSEVPAMPVSL